MRKKESASATLLPTCHFINAPEQDYRLQWRKWPEYTGELACGKKSPPRVEVRTFHQSRMKDGKKPNLTCRMMPKRLAAGVFYDGVIERQRSRDQNYLTRSSMISLARATPGQLICPHACSRAGSGGRGKNNPQPGLGRRLVWFKPQRYLR